MFGTPFDRARDVALGVAAATVVLVGCQSRPKTAADYFRAGDIDTAVYVATHDDAGRETPGAREAAEPYIRAALTSARPTLKLRRLADDEVVALLGGHLARQLLARYFLLRAEVRVQDAFFSGAEAQIVVDAPRGRVPQLGWETRDPFGLALEVTHEPLPAPAPIGSEWVSDVHVPYPALHPESPEFLLSAGAATVEAIVVGPLQLLTLHKVNHYRELSEDEVRALSPNALRLSKEIAHKHEGRVDTSTFVVRRPQEADAALVAHVAVTFHRISPFATVRVSLPLGRDETVDLANAPDVAPGSLPATDDTCGNDCKRAPLVDGSEPSTAGLTVPAAPPRRGTPQTSLAARPSWADDDYAPRVDFPESLTRADATEPIELLVCGIGIAHASGGDASLAFTAGGGRFVRRASEGGRFVVPLVDLEPEGPSGPRRGAARAFTADVLDGDGSSRPALATVSMTRAGGALRLRVTPRERVGVACNGFGHDVVEHEAVRRWLVAADSVEGLEGTTPVVHLGQTDLGLAARFSGVRHEVERVAGLVGWDDPRVTMLAARLAREEERFARAARAAQAAVTAKP